MSKTALQELKRHDYRKGLYFATEAPRCYQPRQDGPPLIFGTDARATMLVHLAIASGPSRLYKLWESLGRHNHGLVRQTVMRP
jgi:hypothetical protein